MPEKERRYHVLRSPLPWRAMGETECGKDASDFAEGIVLTHQQARSTISKHGIQRASLLLCMTCLNFATTYQIGYPRWPTWEEDPVQRLGREFRSAVARRGDVLTAELRAMERLLALYREDFDEILQGLLLGDVVSLTDARKRKRGAS